MAGEQGLTLFKSIRDDLRSASATGKSRSSLVGYGQGAAIPSLLPRLDRVALGDLVHKFMITKTSIIVSLCKNFHML